MFKLHRFYFHWGRGGGGQKSDQCSCWIGCHLIQEWLYGNCMDRLNVGCLRQMIVLQMWALEQVWLCSVNILSWYSISKFQNRILSPGVTLNIHLSILASFFATLIKWSSFSSQISISCSIKFHTKASNTLPVEARGKPLLASKGNKSLNIFNPFFNLANSLSAAAFLPQNLLYLFFNLANSLSAVVSLHLLYHYDNKTSPKIQKMDHFILCLDMPPRHVFLFLPHQTWHLSTSCTTCDIHQMSCGFHICVKLEEGEITAHTFSANCKRWLQEKLK